MATVVGRPAAAATMNRLRYLHTFATVDCETERLETQVLRSFALGRLPLFIGAMTKSWNICLWLSANEHSANAAPSSRIPFSTNKIPTGAEDANMPNEKCLRAMWLQYVIKESDSSAVAAAGSTTEGVK